MVYVEVMYADLSRKRVTINEIDTLPKDNVLFITVLAPDLEKGGKLRRITAKFSKDHYALCIRKWNAVEWVLLFGWDDDDFIWRNMVSPYMVCGSRQEAVPPFGCFHVIFNGLAVSPQVWKEAQRLFSKEV